MAIFQFVGDVYFCAEITVVGSSDFLAVEIDVSDKKYSLEVEKHATPFPTVVGSEGLAIPTCPHFLETSRAQAAFYVGHRIVEIGFLVGRGLNPVLTDLKVVGKIDNSPAAVVKTGHL